jgi:hypothetical protein
MNSAFKGQLHMQDGLKKILYFCSNRLGPPFICSKGHPQWRNVHTLRCKVATGLSYLTADRLGRMHLMHREVSV